MSPATMDLVVELAVSATLDPLAIRTSALLTRTVCGPGAATITEAVTGSEPGAVAVMVADPFCVAAITSPVGLTDTCCASLVLQVILPFAFATSWYVLPCFGRITERSE